MRMSPAASATHWESWHLSEAAVVLAAVGVAGLLVTWARLSRRQRRLLVVGLVGACALLSSGLQVEAMSSYPAHMVEHIVVLLVIAPLFAAATRAHVSRSAATIGFLAVTVLVPLFHLTALGGWVMQYPDGHAVELAAFFVVGVWFWMPVYGAGSSLSESQRVTYCVLALPVIATTGLVLWSSTPSTLHSVGMSMADVTIADVRSGGVVMMSLGTTLMLGHVLALSARAASRQRARRVPAGLKYA